MNYSFSFVAHNREEDIVLGYLCEQQSQLRPHILWFVEVLDIDADMSISYLLEKAVDGMQKVFESLSKI